VRKPRPSLGVALGKLYPQDDETVAAAAFEQLSRAAVGAVALPRPLPAPSNVYRLLLDSLVVLDDIKPSSGPYDWSPTQSDRLKPNGTLASWFSLPWGGPDVVVLPGFHTLAESGLRKTSAAGNDLFLALCGLMSTGTRTVLISRWRVGGQTSFDLVREFVQELPHSSPAEAWQRSVQVATGTPLEVEHEPRIKKGSPAPEALKASHPFFWAGYMLVDTGRRDESAEPPRDLAQPANPPVAVAPPPPPDAGQETAPPGRPKKVKAPKAVKKPPPARRPKSPPVDADE
jgi:hypothetical protein